MSFTQAEHLYAGINEHGINDLLNAFFNARGGYLHYFTPPFVPSNSAATAMPPITFPFSMLGLSYNITVNYIVDFTNPSVDVQPDNSGSPFSPPPQSGEFTVRTTMTGTIELTAKLQSFPYTAITSGPINLSSSPLEVWGLCAPVVISSQPGTGVIGINVKKVIVIPPTSILGVNIDTIMLNVLQSILKDVKIPFHTFTAGAFGLILLAGPVAETDHFKVRGNAL